MCSVQLHSQDCRSLCEDMHKDNNATQNSGLIPSIDWIWLHWFFWLDKEDRSELCQNSCRFSCIIIWDQFQADAEGKRRVHLDRVHSNISITCLIWGIVACSHWLNAFNDFYSQPVLSKSTYKAQWRYTEHHRLVYNNFIKSIQNIFKAKTCLTFLIWLETDVHRGITHSGDSVWSQYSISSHWSFWSD